MRLYDGESTVEWYYAGTMTREQMETSSYYAKVVNEPCVLFDDADGKVVTFEPLSELAVKLAVPTCYTSEQVFGEVKAKLEGTYKAPGVAEVEEKADAAQTAAQAASETAATAQTTADEAKGAVADATSAAQTASEAAATAQTTADEAKATADTAAASMNEYMDALLGLDATDETGATDAE